MNLYNTIWGSLYDNYYAPFRFHPIYLQTQKYLTQSNLLNCDSILDVWCGTWSLLDLLLLGWYQGKVSGVDISSIMINKAREKIPWGSFQVADVHTLPFDDASFWLIMSTISFHHYKKPLIALWEMKRILKNDGMLIIVDVSPEKQTLFTEFMNLLQVFDGWIRCYDESEYSCMCEELQLSIIKIKKLQAKLSPVRLYHVGK